MDLDPVVYATVQHNNQSEARPRATAGALRRYVGAAHSLTHGVA
jgi:hypothetical protein